MKRLSWISITLFVVAWFTAGVVNNIPNRAWYVGLAATVVLGAPGAYSYASDLAARMNLPGSKMQRTVRGVLKSSILALHDDPGLERYFDSQEFASGMLRVGFHVWVFPVWYQRLPAFAIRYFNPPLQALATYNIARDSESTSGIAFRETVGLVGRSVEEGNKDEILVVRFETDECMAAMEGGDSVWKEADVEINQNLTLEEATSLSKRYSRAAAVALQRGNRSYGCVTIELPRGCKLRLPPVEGAKHQQKEPIYRYLCSTAKQVHSHLT